jgi:hypothetical protein
MPQQRQPKLLTVVVLGAGASFDCASDEVERNTLRQPPLAKELFEKRFAGVLHHYPHAEDVAPALRDATASGAVALETYLRDHLRDAADRHDRWRYVSVPLYLQHLMWWISQDGTYTTHADNYSRLIRATLQLQRVIFVTLNYDTLFDERLFRYSPLGLSDMYSYVAGHGRRNWMLVKLHGSVNWGQRVLNFRREQLPREHDDNELRPGDYFEPWFRSVGPNLELDTEVVLRRNPNLGSMRWESDLYYPALSAPLGSEDEFACPPNHVGTFTNELRTHDDIHLLTIGYSALDNAVLKLLARAEGKISKIAVVAESVESSRVTFDRIINALGYSVGAQFFENGFNNFARDGSLDTWMAQEAGEQALSHM